MHYVDDFLYISTNKDNVTKFLHTMFYGMKYKLILYIKLYIYIYCKFINNFINLYINIFIDERGKTEYGLSVNIAKSLTNFEIEHPIYNLNSNIIFKNLYILILLLIL